MEENRLKFYYSLDQTYMIVLEQLVRGLVISLDHLIVLFGETSGAEAQFGNFDSRGAKCAVLHVRS